MNPEQESLETTDIIDLQDLSNEPLDIDASKDLLSATDIELDEVYSDGLNIERAKKAIELAEEMKIQASSKLTKEVIETMFPAIEQREEYYKNTAQRLYTEIHKQAKAYIKEWCKINGYRQVWTNPFSAFFSTKKLTFMSKFIPQVYCLHVKNIETGVSEVLADSMPTPREAMIYGAKRLGFDNSTRRALAFSKFSKAAVETIIKEPRYLNEQRALLLFEEYRKQIDSRSYINSALRDKWKQELEKNSAMSGGTI